MRTRSGFTLIEILVVIAILGVLAGVAFGAFLPSQQKARDARRKSDLHAIAQALEMYANDHAGLYPPSSSGKIVSCGVVATPEACDWGGIFGTDDTEVGFEEVIYMQVLPSSPNSFGSYFYVSAGGSTYTLYSPLENDQDRDRVMSGENAAYYDLNDDDFATDCGSQACLYGVASSNSSLITPKVPNE